MIIGCRIKTEEIVSDVFVHLLNNKKNLLAEADLITDLYKETKRLSICQLHKKRNNTSNFRNIQVEWDSLTIQSNEMSIHPLVSSFRNSNFIGL